MTLRAAAPVQLSPDLSQTYALAAPVADLSEGIHTGRFSDDFSRTHPGPYRWSPRQINVNGIEVEAVKPPETTAHPQHDLMLSFDLNIKVRRAKVAD